VILTRPIREVLVATPRTHIVRIALQGEAFSYLAGQAVMVGAQGGDRRRPYSLADSPEHSRQFDCLELLVTSDGSSGNEPPFRLEAGEMVEIEGPLGRFTLPESAPERRFLFIAGGTGIAPLRAMFRRALTLPHYEIGVLYSARTARDFAYEAELRDLAARGQLELELRVTRDGSLGEWSGTRGRFKSVDLAPLVHGRETLCFVCGPPALVEEIPKALEELGVPRSRIRTEEWI
jgi:ferredoxin-NADP reductase